MRLPRFAGNDQNWGMTAGDVRPTDTRFPLGFYRDGFAAAPVTTHLPSLRELPLTAFRIRATAPLRPGTNNATISL